MKRIISQAVRLVLVLSLVTGVLYPLGMTLFASFAFPHRAGGSIIRHHGTAVGSELIGQPADSSIYFHGRPSAVSYGTIPSGASNASPTNRALRDSVVARRNRFIAGNQLAPDAFVPIEMLTASGSGLDPHISPEAALLQVNRIAKARSLGTDGARTLVALVDRMTERPAFGFLGQPRVNVLLLNLALDAEQPLHADAKRP